jgi:hypothetical protein
MAQAQARAPTHTDRASGDCPCPRLETRATVDALLTPRGGGRLLAQLCMLACQALDDYEPLRVRTVALSS